jgi:hypothetical protein
LQINGEYCYIKIKASYDRILAKGNLVRKILENATEKEEKKSKGNLRNKDYFVFAKRIVI